MACTTESVFTWVGAFLVNAGFILYISWGTYYASWVVTFLISCVYTALLFVAAYGFDRYGHVIRFYRFQSADVEAIDQRIEQTSAASPSLLPQVLFGLAVLALGATGFFLPANLSPCKGLYGSSRDYRSQWQPNLTEVPSRLQTWATRAGNEWGNAYPSFAQLPGHKMTVFRASTDSYQERVSVVAEGPVTHFESFASPRKFTVVNDNSICFSAESTLGCCYLNLHDFTAVGCSAPKGRAVKKAFQLVANEGILWFKDMPARNSESGHILVSLNVTTMEPSIHSFLQKSTSKSGGRHSLPACYQTQAVSALFVSALPISLVSLLLWRRYTTDSGDSLAMSMSGTMWIGLTLTFVCLVLAMAPMTDRFDKYLEWWWVLTAPGWVYVLTTKFPHEPRLLGVSLGTVSFFLAGCLLLLDGTMDGINEAWRWILANTLVFGPIAIWGLAVDRMSMLIVFAVGILMDIAYVTGKLTDRFPDQAPLIVLVVVAGCGMGLAVSGWFLRHWQGDVRAWIRQRLIWILPEESDDGQPFFSLDPYHDDEQQQLTLADNEATEEPDTEPFRLEGRDDDQGQQKE